MVRDVASAQRGGGVGVASERAAQGVGLGLVHKPGIPDGIRPRRTQEAYRRGVRQVQGGVRLMAEERRLVAARRLVNGLHGEDIRSRRVLHLPRAGLHRRLRP